MYVVCVYLYRVSTVSLDNDIQTTSSSTLVAGGKNILVYYVMDSNIICCLEGVRPNVQAVTSSPKPEVVTCNYKAFRIHYNYVSWKLDRFFATKITEFNSQNQICNKESPF